MLEWLLFMKVRHGQKTNMKGLKETLYVFMESKN